MSVLPLTEKLTPPAAMEAPEGLAKAGTADAVKAALTAKASAWRDGRSRAYAPWSRRCVCARERRELLTYPPDPSVNFSGGNNRLRCYARAMPELRNYITIPTLRAHHLIDFASDLPPWGDSCC
jgi:hypothetical protein